MVLLNIYFLKYLAKKHQIHQNTSSFFSPPATIALSMIITLAYSFPKKNNDFEMNRISSRCCHPASRACQCYCLRNNRSCDCTAVTVFPWPAFVNFRETCRATTKT